jgi:hypothetical protein
MINNKKLAEYIYKRIIKKPTEDELEFWIQQFKTKDCCGHSEWSERFQQNIWIEDEED